MCCPGFFSLSCRSPFTGRAGVYLDTASLYLGCTWHFRGELRAGCKGREAGKHIPGRKVAQSISGLLGYAQACAEGRGGGMKLSWSFQSVVEHLYRSCAELLSEGKINCHAFRVSWSGFSQHWWSSRHWESVYGKLPLESSLHTRKEEPHLSRGLREVSEISCETF